MSLHPLTGEVAAPALVNLLLPLVTLAVLIVALGLANLADLFCRALFGSVGGVLAKIPWVSHVVTGPVHAIESRLTSALGSAVAGIESKIGAYFHTLAFEVTQLGHTIRETAETVAALAVALGTLTDPAEVKKLWQSLVGSEKATLGRVQHAQATASKALAQQRANSRTQAQSAAHIAVEPVRRELRAVEHTLTAKVGALEHDITDVLTPDIAGLRARTRSIADSAMRAYEWARGHWRVASVGAAAAVVAVALGRLNLSWIRCRNVEKAGRGVCGMDAGLLESLLAGAVLATGPISIVELAEACQGVVGFASEATEWFVAEFGKAVKDAGGAVP